MGDIAEELEHSDYSLAKLYPQDELVNRVKPFVSDEVSREDIIAVVNRIFLPTRLWEAEQNGYLIYRTFAKDIAEIGIAQFNLPANLKETADAYKKECERLDKLEKQEEELNELGELIPPKIQQIKAEMKKLTLKLLKANDIDIKGLEELQKLRSFANILSDEDMIRSNRQFTSDFELRKDRRIREIKRLEVCRKVYEANEELNEVKECHEAAVH
jgi:hypothetical protein